MNTTSIPRKTEATVEDVERFAHVLGVTCYVNNGAMVLSKEGSIDTGSIPFSGVYPTIQSGINAACGALVHLQTHLQMLRRS